VKEGLSIIIPSCAEKNIGIMKVKCLSLFPQAQIVIGNDLQRQGKGYIIKDSMYKVLGGIIVFIDGDLDIHPRMIKRLLPFLEDYDIAVGSKGIGGLPFNRKIITLLSRIYIKLLFNLDVTTQTGIKAFRRYRIPEWGVNGFAFDIEVLAKAKKLGMKMVEVPVEAKSTKSKSMGVLWRAFLDSLKIWYRLYCRNEKTKI
jgi:glycosyltransferase involved in cell wall biosynthesis